MLQKITKLAAQLALSLAACHAQAAFVQVPLANLDVTSGGDGTRELASGLIEVTSHTFRATERGAPSRGAKLTFAYRGETEQRSGLDRIQIGEKLLSLNPCNLLYVMWRLYPEEGVVVSIKRHPGSTSQECGNEGYTNIVPGMYPPNATNSFIPVSAALSARGGATRTLQANFVRRSRIFEVRIDNQVVWRGVPPSSLINGLSGPSGVRTDNAQTRFRFYAEH